MKEETLMGRTAQWKDRVYHIPMDEFLKNLNLEGDKVMEIKMLVDDEKTLVIRTRGE